VVVLTVSLALVVLALAAVGLRVAGGRERRQEVKNIPSRLVPLPPTTVPSTSVPAPAPPAPAQPAPSPPATVPSTAPRLDTSTPKITMTDADGRFAITVPRSWVNLPVIEPGIVQFRLFEQAADGSVKQSEFIFMVRWFDAKGCALGVCAEEHLLRLQAGRPAVVFTVTPEAVAGRQGVRFDSSLPNQRLAGWLVPDDDRYWVMELVGPQAGFDQVLSVVRPVLASMSFG